MKSIKSSYDILTPIDGVKELQLIERIGRVCYKSEDKITEDGESARKFVRMLVKHGHEAMIEHSTLSVKFIVDRGVSHELVRHRIASFAQESTRYCNYSNDKFNGECTFIDINAGAYMDRGMDKLTGEQINEVIAEWTLACEDAERHYLKMLELGATPQIARGVLPNSVKTEITVTANYREWRNFFKLRVPVTAHPQMREIAIPLLVELQSKLPDVFGDIEAWQ